VLLPPISPAPWSSGFKHACAGCGELVAGLEVGGYCADCWRARTRRAGRIARWAALAATLPFAVYLMLALPPTREWRLMGAATAVVWYFLTGLIARRVVLEWLK